MWLLRVEPSTFASEDYEFSDSREQEPALGFTGFVLRVSKITSWPVYEKSLLGISR